MYLTIYLCIGENNEPKIGVGNASDELDELEAYLESLNN
jgi:hypothetical protein